MFETRDLDEAREQVAGKFCRHTLHILSGDRHFSATQHHAKGEMISLSYLRYGATVRIEPGELERFYLIQIPLRGQALVQHGGVAVASDETRATVLSPSRYTRMLWSGDCEQVLVQIDKVRLTAFAGRLLDRDMAAEVVFDPAVSFSGPALSNWRRYVFGLLAAADRGHMFGGETGLLQEAVEEELLSAFLSRQPSNIAHFLSRQSRAGRARYLMRADDFIRANSHNPICLSQIAEAAGVSIRSLQLGFRHISGCTPMQVLRRERLNRARHELLTGDPKNTIAQVACQSGFPHFGRFAQYYKREFGELPIETVRSSREKGHRIDFHRASEIEGRFLATL